jgi:TIR domain
MTAKIGAHGLGLFHNPRPELLADVTGIRPKPGEAWVDIQGRLGFRSTQRLWISDVDDGVAAATWPAETAGQARYLYDRKLGTALVSAAIDLGWIVEPSPHIAFYNSKPGSRLYIRPPVAPLDYVACWQEKGALGRVRYPRDDVERQLWPWLKNRGLVDDSDDAELRRFLSDFLHMPHADMRPGLRFRRIWTSAEAARLGPTLAETIRSEFDAVFATVDEPALATLQGPFADATRDPGPARGHDAEKARLDRASGVQLGSGNVQVNNFYGDPARPAFGGTRPAGRRAGSSPSRGHAFVSYAREDSGEVDALQKTLEEAGIRVWRDTSDLWPGEDWRAKIRGAITNDALVFIACFSGRGVARQTSYQNEELLLAIDQLRRRRPDDPWLIPVRFDDCDVPDFELGAGRTLASIQWADLFGPRRDLAAGRLVEAVQRLLGQPSTPTAEHPSPGAGAGGTADTLARIELERRKGELTPLFRVRCEPWTAGNDADLRLRVQLAGPTSLGRIDGVTVTIRDDHFRRGEGTLMAGGPTRDQVKQQIWGPYRFRPGTGPDEARADATGRVTVYAAELPVGEELPYFLERTRPPLWATNMTQESWNQQRGPVIRLLLEPRRNDYGEWRLPCEIDLSTDHDQHYAGWTTDVRP